MSSHDAKEKRTEKTAIHARTLFFLRKIYALHV
jgi:hypothetical protein